MTNKPPLRILIAEDSTLFVEVITELLESDGDIEVISVAEDGIQAVEQCIAHRPDLIVMDIRMPRLDGLSATELIMARAPTPILVMTSDPYQDGVHLSFRALSAGALDLVRKPDHFPLSDNERRELLRKVRLLAEIPVVRHLRGRNKVHTPVPPSSSEFGRRPTLPRAEHGPFIAIAASTGGPKALAMLLGAMPAELPASVLIVQHISAGFSTHLARWLDANSELHVEEAIHGDQPKPGHVYLAPSDKHLEISSSGYLRLSNNDPVNGHRPSANLLFQSLARHAPRSTIGCVLSGMGDDGAQGLKALSEAGAYTIVQDRDSAVVYGMPQSALELGGVRAVVPLRKMARALTQRLAQRGEKS